MHQSKPPRLAELSINEFSKNGHGLAHFTQPDGNITTVEVPFSLPNERVEVSLSKRHKGVTQSSLLKIVHSSSTRIPAKCEHFGACGGCRWQHLPYVQQLELKEKWILEGLKPYLNTSTIIHSIIPCDPPWHYRNKAEFTFSTDKAMNYYLGFILFNGRGKVFNLKECYLIPAWMSKAVQLVREWWIDSGLDAYHGMKDTGSLRTLTLREGKRTGDKMVFLTVSGNADYALKKEQLNSFIAIFENNLELECEKGRLSIFLRIQQIAKGKPTNFYEMQLYGTDHIEETLQYVSNTGESNTLKFQISPTAFFQPNTTQAEKIYQKVRDIIQTQKDIVVYDLYCGTGTFGIFLAQHANIKKVYGIELCPESVLDARENIKLNGLTNIEIHQGDVAKILPDLLTNEDERPEIVIVDPPRAGLDHKALTHILSINAPQIIYISCNPITQSANLGLLTQAGYFIKLVQPVDQFPHTIHVENIVHLTRYE